MHFIINHDLLVEAGLALYERKRLFWVVGGAGSGKTTICAALSARFGFPVYDMDGHIYGIYHGSFTPERHPVNTAWSTAPNGLAWLLDMSWDEFDQFNRAALPEYLDLLTADLAAVDPAAPLLIDGGICNPALITGAIPTHQIACLAGPDRTSADIWQATGERLAMKALIDELPNPAEAWQRFLEFDSGITRTILQECRDRQIPIITRGETESVDQTAANVARVWGLWKRETIDE